MMGNKIAGLAAAILALLAGCRGAGELQTQSASMDAEGAESLRATVRMESGDLTVTDGAEKMLEADFAYNVAEMKPEIKYRVSQKQGELVITQPDIKGWRMPSGARNDWVLRFNREMPLDLRFIQSAVKSDLILRHLNLHQISFKIVKGEVAADLSGDHAALSRLDVDTESGDVTMKLTGAYASLTRLKTIASSGTIRMDLTGSWQCDLRATCRSTSGYILLHLPPDAGVRIKARTITGKVEAEGLQFKNSVYLNDAYGQSDISLDLELYSSSGDIILK